MANTGAITSGTIVSTGAWTNWTTAYLVSIDALRASTGNTSYTSGVLRNFNFGVPAGATILGVVVSVSMSSDNSSANCVVRVAISKNAGGAWSAYTADQTESTTETTHNFGAADSTWGLSLSAAEVNDTANFYVDISGYCSKSGKNALINYVATTVYYETGLGPNYVQSMVIY